MKTRQAASNVMRRAQGAVLAGLILLLPIPAAAEIIMNSAGGEGFKRIKVSDNLPGKRITVQIDPAE